MSAPAAIYKPTSAEEKHLSKWYDRFAKARDGRSTYDQHFEEYEKQWEGFWEDSAEDIEQESEDEHRSSVWVPMTFALVMTAMTEYIQQNPSLIIKPPSGEDAPYAEIQQAIAENSLSKGRFIIELYRTFLDAGIFGTCPIYEYYRCDTQEIKDLTHFDPETMKYEYKKKKVKRFDDCYAKSISPYMWYPRPQATDMEDCGWAFLRFVLDLNQFKQFYSGKFPNAKKVMASGDHLSTSPDWKWWDTSGMQYMGENSVDVLWGFDEWSDEMVIMANGVLLSKPDMPIPYKHKRIPVALIHSTMRPRRIWGKGMCEIINKLQFERNVNRNLALDQSRLNILKIMFVNTAAGLGQDSLNLRPGIAIPVDGDPRKAVYPLEYGGLKADRYKEEEMITHDATQATGISPELTGVKGAESATQAAIMKESSLKRIQLQMKLSYRDGMTRLGQMRCSNIRQFYTQPTRVEKVVGKDEVERIVKHYRNVVLKDQALAVSEETGEYYMQKGLQGWYDFKVTPDLFKEDKEPVTFYDYDIDVDPQSAIKVSLALEKEQETRFFEVFRDDPDVDQVKLKEDYIRALDKNPDRLLIRPEEGMMAGEGEGAMGGNDEEIAGAILQELYGGGGGEMMGAPAGMPAGAPPALPAPAPAGRPAPMPTGTNEALSRALPNYGGAGV